MVNKKMSRFTNIPSYEMFSMEGDKNIVEQEHLGIFNGMLTVNTIYRDVFSFRSLIAPPYVSSDFVLEIRLFGEKVSTQEYKWYPFKIERSGKIKGIMVKSSLVLVESMRIGIMIISLENQGQGKEKVPLQFNITGGLDNINFYGFNFPEGRKKCITINQRKKLIRRNDSGAIIITTDIRNLTWEEFSSHWETNIRLDSRANKIFHVVVGIGAMPKVEFDCEKVLRYPREMLEKTHDAWVRKTDNLFIKIPKLKANNGALVKFYNRSILPFLLNRWEVPEFVLHPYYSLGGINGGCIGLYLWDYGIPCKILPLYEISSVKEHIKQFLKMDLTAHFAFSPGNGEGFGPWYPINQEKIVSLIYYYILHTGDFEFLNEKVNGKSILEWAIYHATYRDDFNKRAVLVDYGIGNNHLELRGKYRYDNFMPDLNGKRYQSYKMVGTLCKIIGTKPPVDFFKRAEDLKLLIKDKLWDKGKKWFVWLGDAQQTRNLRYTVEIFELFSTGVLDKEEEKGLLGHLNDEEFLSTYGLHSISKKDQAYDQDDIDCGGGGSYVSFPLQIIERLYNSNHYKEAEIILKRILWWGERLPYWGDSLVANNIDYRRDTPLQNSIGALAGAQCVIFGMFGVEIKPNGDVIINPHPPVFSSEIELMKLNIRGTIMDISVKKDVFYVRVKGQSIKSEVGRPIMFNSVEKTLKITGSKGG